MDTQRLIAFIIFCFSGLMLWDAWHKQGQPPAPPPAQTAPAPQTPGAPGATTTPSTTLAPPATPTQADKPTAPTASAVAPGKRITVRTDKIVAQIDTNGADLREISLNEHNSARDKAQPMKLVREQGGAYLVPQTGFTGGALPNHNTAFTADREEFALAPGEQKIEVPLTHVAADGTRTTKTYVFRRGSYLVDLNLTVSGPGAAQGGFAYFQWLRDSQSPEGESKGIEALGAVATYTGPALYTDANKFLKVSFSDLDKGKGIDSQKAKDGWVAMIQHYFVSAFLPPPGVERELFVRKTGNLYAAGVVVPVARAADGSLSVSMPVFVGPQEVATLKSLAAPQAGQAAPLAAGFDLVVDYGWTTVIAVPMFWLLNTIHSFVGNWGWAIVLLTALLRLGFYPLQAKSYRSFAHMKHLAPKIERLKQLHGEDRQKMSQAMMELYKTEKVNPFGGCLPIVVQIPVFIALYSVLLASVELRQAPWLGWIKDLSIADPFFILPVVLAVLMFVQTKLSPPPPDPVQAKVMMMMPIIFSMFFLFLPSGLNLYSVVNTALSIAQQWYITRKLEAEFSAKKAKA